MENPVPDPVRSVLSSRGYRPVGHTRKVAHYRRGSVVLRVSPSRLTARRVPENAAAPRAGRDRLGWCRPTPVAVGRFLESLPEPSAAP